MRERYMKAPTFLEYLENVEQNIELWNQIYRRVEITNEALQGLQDCEKKWHLLGLTQLSLAGLLGDI